MITKGEQKSNISLTEDTPGLALRGELWGVYCENFGKKIDCVITASHCNCQHGKWPPCRQASKVRCDHLSLETYTPTDTWRNNYPMIMCSLRMISRQQENSIPWWRHQMETFSALLALCAGNSPDTGEFPSQRPVTRSFDVLFDLRMNKRLS